MKISYSITSVIAFAILLFACGPKEKPIKEELAFEPESSVPKDTTNSVKRDLKLSEIATYPQEVILNGMPEHRLVTIYRYLPPRKQDRSEYSSYSYSGEYYDADDYSHFMPGLDLQFGYNLVNVAHYNMKSQKSNYLFENPVLVKSLYYPSWEQDSIGEKPNRKPINRDYFLVSAYDEDTNKDTLLNKFDLRRFYHFNAACDVKTRLIPADYSVVRSQYDVDNDVMYIYAKHDDNQDGKIQRSEATHIFWMSLKIPGPAVRMY
jgi:hypothetical protein